MEQQSQPSTEALSCRPISASTSQLPALAAVDINGPTIIAPGDRVRIRVVGDTDRLTGVYVVGSDGTIDMSPAGSILAAGLTQTELEAAVTHRLVASGQIQALPHPVDLRVIEISGVSVAVSGAVFDPGVVRAGERNAETRIGQKEGTASGDINGGRTLATALRAAGGLRPDADIAHVQLIRDGRAITLDLDGALVGSTTADIALTAGDRVIVPSTGCFDARLARPSPVTTPGIRVYMSNLSRPASSNASSAIGKETTSLPYGTRLLQGLAAMNCVGGSVMNAGRRAVLISRNPMNGKSIVIERRIEHLVRDAGRDQIDPYLMPGDALACYDSRWMNLQDAVGVVSNAISTVTPAIILRDAIRK